MRHLVLLVIRDSPYLLHSSLELSDTHNTVYEPQIRARLGTAAHFCEVVVLKLKTVPIGTALSLRILHALGCSARVAKTTESQNQGCENNGILKSRPRNLKNGRHGSDSVVPQGGVRGVRCLNFWRVT